MLSHSVFLVLRHIQAWRDPCGTLSRFQASGNRCRKVQEIVNWRVRKILKWKLERILSEQRNIHDFLDKKADHAFQGEFVVHRIFSEAQSELDRRGWRLRNADIALYDTGMQFGTLSGKSSVTLDTVPLLLVLGMSTPWTTTCNQASRLTCHARCVVWERNLLVCRFVRRFHKASKRRSSRSLRWGHACSNSARTLR